MIKDRSRKLSTYYFSANLPWVSLSFYDYCLVDKQRIWYHKENFNSLLLDITLSEEELLASYQQRLRTYVRLAKELPFTFHIHRDGRPYYDLQDTIVQAHDAVTYYPMSLLEPRHHRVFTTVSHPDYGVLAMHGHLLDVANKTVLLSMNLSKYRSFSDPAAKKLAGTANKYLFHQDFLHFQSAGFHQYDMGGYEFPSLIQFKKGFGGKIVPYFRYSPKIWRFLKRILSGK